MVWCSQEVEDKDDNTENAEIHQLFLGCAASAHMINTSSSLIKIVTEVRECRVRVKGSCRATEGTEADTKGRLYFKLQTVEGRPISVHLEVLNVPKLVADNLFSVGELEEKAIWLNLVCDLPALKFGYQASPIGEEINKAHGCPTSGYRG